ncbi:MAG TPA: 4-hydroxy-tetrahydrodipicolinate synthase [Acidiferrobacteraceae bacterium]|nr:4-hydroxy-tetrahydrodipicolinate synthase [Acidiferrobacteraceae bacterium]
MFHGSMVALVTPMLADGSLDDTGLKKLVDFHVDNGTRAIISVGTTGESATLDFDEHCQVMARTVEYAAGRIAVIGGTGSNSTREAIALTRCAHQVGVDACLLVTPYYNKPTQEGLYQHHIAVAEAVPVPQILYNVPGRTACDMLTETVVRLSKHDNIVGIKDATGDMRRAQEIMGQCDDRFSLYSGDDATGLELMLLGGKGVISVTANIAPQAMSKMCVAATAGQGSAAREIDIGLAGLHEKLFVEANPIPVKWALQEMGMIDSGIRLPLTPLSSRFHDTVRQAMKQASVTR